MTIAEKIIAAAAGVPEVKPGDIENVKENNKKKKESVYPFYKDKF